MNKTRTAVLIVTALSYLLALYGASSADVPEGYRSNVVQMTIGMFFFGAGAVALLIPEVKPKIKDELFNPRA